MSEAWKNWEGLVIDRQFPLRLLLGKSDHSAVFATERPGRGLRKAAIKLLIADADGVEAQLARWRQAARLSHPNLLPLFDCGRCRLGDSDMLFAVMEFAEETLADVLPQRTLSGEEGRQMLRPVLDALSYLHGQGFVHGNLRATNVFAVGEVVKLSSDTIHAIQDGGGSASPGTRRGCADPAGDIYSLGLMLVQALTPRAPFDAGASPGHAGKPLPTPFDNIVVNALHPDPQLRWTALDIRERLNPATALAPSVAQPAASADGAPASTPLPAAAPRMDAADRKRSSLPRYAAFSVLAIIALFVVLRLPHRGMVAPTPTSAAKSSREGDGALPAEAGSVKAPETAAPAAKQRQPKPAVLRPDARPTETRASTNADVAQQVMPHASPSALATIHGTVRLAVRAQVDAAGKVRDAQIESKSGSAYFNDLALQAARKWLFRPANATDGAERSYVLRFEFTQSGPKASASLAR